MLAGRMPLLRDSASCMGLQQPPMSLHKPALIPIPHKAAVSSAHPLKRQCRASSQPSFEPGISNNNIDSLQERQQMQRLQSLQQQRQQAQPQLSGEESDLLWAGYSALEEQLQKHHRRHEALVAQIQELQVKLQVVQQQPPASAWQAASFLLFFLFFINFVGLLANLQMGWVLPWTAAKASASSLWFKQLLTVALPFTNTVVILIFCMQAIKAAWTCLKW